MATKPKIEILSTVDYGDVQVLTMIFKARGDDGTYVQLVDPSAIEVIIEKPDGTRDTYEWPDEYDSITGGNDEDNLGTFELQVTCDQGGEWYAQIVATGAGASGQACSWTVNPPVATDPEHEPVPSSRTFTPKRTDDRGLYDCDRRTIKIGPANAYAVELRHDMTLGLRIATIDSITRVKGHAGGITFNDSAEWDVDKTKMIFRPTGVTAGDYEVEIAFTYDSGSDDKATILFKVVN